MTPPKKIDASLSLRVKKAEIKIDKVSFIVNVW